MKSGEGYKYRGRGLIQITGRGNYSALVTHLRVDIVNNPEKLTEPNLAVESAVAWWKNNGLNEVADSDDVDRITVSLTAVRMEWKTGNPGYSKLRGFYAQRNKLYPKQHRHLHCRAILPRTMGIEHT